MVKTATESMEKNTKKRELEAKIKIDVCISGMQFKIKQAESINMCYAKINDIDVASWKLINCLVENKVVTGIDPSLEHKKKRLNQEQGDGVKTLTNFDCQDNHYEADDFKLAFGGKGQRKKKSVIDANKNIKKCMDELETKMKSSIDKNIYFAKVSGIDVVSWKIIDCLVEDEIVDERVQIAKPKKFWKENQGSPGCHSPRNSKRTQGSHEKHRRSKSLPRFHQREIHGHAGSPREKRTLYFNDDEDVDGFNVDAFINPSTYTAGTGAQSETYYKCLNSVLEKQKKIGLKKEFLRKTDVCAECEKKEQHVKRYRAERDELKLDKKRLETVMVG
ncbi:uncharacterized protein LOC143043702 [Mytilus galloprovincialis]|uniref:uncharacterized protein LOC143043702 n=1 Tax=Mytilus galloprovincialis TaxID=29158 RepID=UPI003F7C23CF